MPFWNPAEPNDCCDPGIDSQENYAQHVGTGRLNDLPNGNNLAGVLEIINPNRASHTWLHLHRILAYRIELCTLLL